MTVPNKPSKVLTLHGKKQLTLYFPVKEAFLLLLRDVWILLVTICPQCLFFLERKVNPILMTLLLAHLLSIMRVDGFRKTASLFDSRNSLSFLVLQLKSQCFYFLMDTLLIPKMWIKLAWGNNVIILCFPPHCSHLTYHLWLLWWHIMNKRCEND